MNEDILDKVKGLTDLLWAAAAQSKDGVRTESGNVNIKAIDVLSEYSYTVKEEFESYFNGLQE